MNMTTLSGNQLLQALKQVRNETRLGLYDVFIAKLERLACFIRSNNLSATEAAELIDSEIELMRAQHRGDV